MTDDDFPTDDLSDTARIEAALHLAGLVTKLERYRADPECVETLDPIENAFALECVVETLGLLRTLCVSLAKRVEKLEETVRFLRS